MADSIDPTRTLAPQPQPPQAIQASRVPQLDFERDMRPRDPANPKSPKVPSSLTRKGMEDVIRRGQSVMYGGSVLTSIDQLPSDADLASRSGSTDEMERVRRDKEAEIDRLRNEVDSLRKNQAAQQQKDTVAAQAAKAAQDAPAKK